MNYLFKNEFYGSPRYRSPFCQERDSALRLATVSANCHLTGGPAGDICEMRGKGVPIDPGRLR